MGGAANYPTALDDDTSLGNVTDGSSTIQAAHHNNLKEALKAIEAKLGIRNSAAPTSIDYRLGNPTGSHDHNGASGHGAQISPSSWLGLPTLVSDLSRFRLQTMFMGAKDAIASNALPPMYVDRTVQIETFSFIGDIGPSGGTSAYDVNLGATSLWYASQGFRPMFFATSGNARATFGTPNTVTIPSGSMLHVDVDSVGANKGVSNPSIIFVFRE